MFLAIIGQTIPRCSIVLAFDRLHVVLDCVGFVQAVLDCVGCTDDLNLTACDCTRFAKYYSALTFSRFYARLDVSLGVK